MNWLIYIGGYWIWLYICFWIIEGANKFIEGKKSTTIEVISHLIFTMAIWIWICWRFIK